MKLLLLAGLFFSLSFDWQGHRGARGLYPENTIEGMRIASKYAISTLELDVVISRDLQVVVSHEPWMSSEICLTPEKKAIRGREFNLYQMTYQEIAKFDCGSKKHPRFPDQKKASEKKPLLQDLLRDTKSLGRDYNIEIKSTVEDEKAGFQPDYKTFAKLVMKVIRAEIPLERVVVQSFDWRVLRELKKNHPNLKLSALHEGEIKSSEILKKLDFRPSIFSPNYKSLRTSHVKDFHSHKMKIIPWTVNSEDEMRKLLQMGVDGIITDYPNLIP
jgi:glycerophosphoryl diester phosphodiesterase